MQRARAVMSTTQLRFPRCAHLRASAEFQAVFSGGKRVSGTAFRLHVLLKAGATQTRLGVTVSKRVDKAAVRRNRLRRQIKEVFRLQRATLQPGDYVLLAKPEAGKLDNAGVRAELSTLFERARRLPPPAIAETIAAPALNRQTPPALNDPTPPGTMPASDAPCRRDSTE